MDRILILQHIACEGPGTIQPFFESRGYEFDFCALFQENSIPDCPQPYAAVISLGGPMNVLLKD